MWPKMKSAKTYLIPSGLAMMLYFQNCAPPASFEAASEDFASMGQSFEVLHEDSDRTLPGEEKIRLETTYEPLLADRYYLRDLFVDVFGPSAVSVRYATTIFSEASEFGSLCSVYEDYYVKNAAGNAVRYDFASVCSPGSAYHTQAPGIPKPTAKRQAFVTRYCSDLVSTAATFDYSLKRISSEAVPKATRQNILNLFRLFYRAHPDPQPGLIDSLQLMFSAETPAKDEWRAVIYGVCASSQWQVL